MFAKQVPQPTMLTEMEPQAFAELIKQLGDRNQKLSEATIKEALPKLSLNPLQQRFIDLIQKEGGENDGRR